MKRTIIAAFVGGLFIFIWQFLSWGLLNLHQPAQQYTPKQNEILDFLSQQNLPEGGYYMPGSPDGVSMEEYEKVLQASEGKPWATIQYHHRLKNNMGMNMARGIIINFITVALLCWIITRMQVRSFAAVFTATIFTGLIVFFNAPYTNAIWYDSFDTWAHLADALASWGLCGLWLGWYLKKPGKAAGHTWTRASAAANAA